MVVSKRTPTYEDMHMAQEESKIEKIMWEEMPPSGETGRHLTMPFGNLILEVSEVTLRNRYPEKDYLINPDSDILACVLEGTLVVGFEGKVATLEKDHLANIESGYKYFFDPKTDQVKLRLFTQLKRSAS